MYLSLSGVYTAFVPLVYNSKHDLENHIEVYEEVARVDTKAVDGRRSLKAPSPATAKETWQGRRRL